MAEFMAVSEAAANSADFTLAEGGQATLLLKDGTAGAVLTRGVSANIQVKTSGGVYMQLGQLTAEVPMLTVTGAGTYRVSKPAGYALGIDKN